MKPMRLPTQWPQAWPDYLLLAGVVWAGWQATKLFRKGDELAAQATKPLGQLWSDLSAWSGGWRPVQLTSLRILSHMLDDDYRLMPEARAVITKIPAYQTDIRRMFTTDYVMKPEFRYLIVQSN